MTFKVNINFLMAIIQNKHSCRDNLIFNSKHHLLGRLLDPVTGGLNINNHYKDYVLCFSHLPGIIQQNVMFSTSRDHPNCRKSMQNALFSLYLHDHNKASESRCVPVTGAFIKITPTIMSLHIQFCAVQFFFGFTFL